MPALSSFLLLTFRSSLIAWALAFTCAICLPLAWQAMHWPTDLSLWLGPSWQWLNLPWALVVACWAAIAWSRQNAIAHHTNVAHDIYSAAYRTLPDAAGITSLKDGRFIDVNPALCHLLGFSPEDMIGHTNTELHVYATPDERDKLLKELTTHGKAHRLRILCRSQRGEIIPGTISAIRIEVEQEPCMLFVFHDMREYDNAVHKLHVVNRQLMHAGHLARLGAWEDRKDQGLVYWSDVCYDIHGLPRGAPLPRDYLQTFVIPAHRERMRAQLQHCLRTHEDWEIEVQIIRKDGRLLWVRSRGELVLNEEGEVIAMRGVTHDIDESKQQEESIREREALLSITLEAASLGRWDWNLHSEMITGDRFWRALHELKVSEPDDETCSSEPYWHWRSLMSPEDAARCSKELIRHTQHPEDGPFDLTWSIPTFQGTNRWVRAMGKVVSVDSDGQATRMLGVTLDVTTQQQQKRHLQQLAHFDPLTGLANRVELAARLDEAMVDARRNQQLLAVVYLDLDNFKPINDRFGHVMGDRFLVLVARRLSRALRKEDCVARFGGDEFVLLLQHLPTREACEARLQQILHNISQPYSLNDEVVQVTASMGYALYPEDESDADALVRHADQAMYQAKQYGRNRIQAFDATKERSRQEQLIQEIRIREGLEHSEFVLYLEPKVDMQAHRVIGVEALARWHHPEKGVLTPKDFLPQIEGGKLEIPFGEWAITAALQIIEQLLAAGLEIQVAVNVSARHLQHPAFAEWMTHLLAAHPHIPAQLLELEITETAALHDLSHAAQVLQQLRLLKLSISLDDFGTGYSSLKYLQSLPLDTLKIDQSFVRDMLSDQGDWAIVQGVASLAKSFGYQVIAEGVESTKQATCLKDIGCYLAQGYCFAPPMPLQQLPSWIAHWENQKAVESLE